MVRGSRVLVTLGVVVLLLGPAVAIGLGRDAPPVTYAPDPPRDVRVPDELDEPSPPPNVLRFAGLITFSDPGDFLFGHDPVLWRESCHMLTISEERRYKDATLNLTAGATDGRFEDLNLFAWDADEELLATWDEHTQGIGNHHTAELPRETATVGVCLKGGMRASYDLTIA